jgi:hypothetical protein
VAWQRSYRRAMVLKHHFRNYDCVASSFAEIDFKQRPVVEKLDIGSVCEPILLAPWL